MKKDGIQYDPSARKWRYILDGKLGRQQYTDKVECAKAYVAAYLDKNPKYREAVSGKTWKQIFSMFQIEVQPKELQF